MIFKIAPFILFLGFGFAGFQALAQDDGDSPQARKAAADRYFQAVSMESMMNDMTVEVSKSLPEDQREIFEDVLMNQLQIDVLEKTARDALIKHFTAPEISALASFYSSKEGQSVLKKMGKYMAEIMPVMQRELISAIKAIEQAKK